MMLTRVPTMMSLHQEDDTTMAYGCIATTVAKRGTFPMMRYALKSENFPMKRLRSFGDLHQTVPDADAGSLASSDDDAAVDRSLLETVLLAKWEDRSARGLFRYDVTACPTKVLDGVYSFVAQLNEGRATKKRPTEFSIDRVLQEYDPGKFNFSKADESEVLFQFEPMASRAPMPRYQDSCSTGASPSVVLINVSPIEYGHVLLVPRVLSALPQQLTPEYILMALHFASESDNPYFRVGYNSLGAYATINHLHFQAYFLTAPFAIERAPTAPLAGSGGKRRRCCGDVTVHRLARYPVRALVFEVGDRLKELGEAVGAAALALQAANVPFNLLITDRGARVFLIPQCFASKAAQGTLPESVLETGINPAAFEIAGHLLYKRREDYEAATQESAWELLSQASLEEGDFNALVEQILPQ